MGCFSRDTSPIIGQSKWLKWDFKKAHLFLGVLSKTIKYAKSQEHWIFACFGAHFKTFRFQLRLGFFMQGVLFFCFFLKWEYGSINLSRSYRTDKNIIKAGHWKHSDIIINRRAILWILFFKNNGDTQYGKLNKIAASGNSIVTCDICLIFYVF